MVKVTCERGERERSDGGVVTGEGRNNGLGFGLVDAQPIEWDQIDKTHHMGKFVILNLNFRVGCYIFPWISHVPIVCIFLVQLHPNYITRRS